MIDSSVIASRLSDEDLRLRIQRSSYARKHILARATVLNSREKLEQAFVACRDYACNSIVDNIMSFNGIKKESIKHLYCNKDTFFLLARVRTNWESGTIEETANVRKYVGFTVLTEKNLSHFPGRVLYGYRKGIDASMIAHIYPCDSDTNGYETDPLKLTKYPELLLDIDDLCEEALRLKAYSQVTIETKIAKRHDGAKEGSALMPDVVVAIDKISADDKLASKERNLPILLIHSEPDTVIRVFDAHDRAELANPALF